MLTTVERKAMNHYFISFPQHINMQAIIDDATSESPQQLFVINPLFNSLPLSHVMAGVCGIIKLFS